MKFIRIGDMNMTNIVLGTDGYGERISEDTAMELMEFYTEYSGNVIDTARLYTSGLSEEIVGKFLKNTHKRKNVYISTKCSHPPLEDMSHSRLGAEDIESDIDASLKALQTDFIDILWLHRDDITLPVEPIIDTLNDMISKGKIRHFGASNWTHDRIMEANRYAAQAGKTGFIASQILYNMATCNEMWDKTLVVSDGEEKKKYDESKMPVFAFCSQAKGFFEKYHNGTLSEKAIRRYENEATIATYHRIAEIAEKEGNSISYTALQLLERQSQFPVLPIIGPSNLSQLKDTLNIK